MKNNGVECWSKEEGWNVVVVARRCGKWGEWSSIVSHGVPVALSYDQKHELTPT